MDAVTGEDKICWQRFSMLKQLNKYMNSMKSLEK
jgi:hypothetical protein